MRSITEHVLHLWQIHSWEAQGLHCCAIPKKTMKLGPKGLTMRTYMYIVQYQLLTNQHSVMALPGLVENFKPKMISSPSLVLLAHSLFTMILFYRGDGVKGLHGNPGGSSPHSDDSDCSINKDSSLITPKSEPSSAHPLKKQLHQVGAYFHKVVTV